MAKPIKDGEERNYGHGNYITTEFIDNNKGKVFKLAQLGCTQKEIAYALNCSVWAIENHFIESFREGQTNLRSSLRKAQVECAIREKNSRLLVWLGKQFLGQREPKQEIEHSGEIVVHRKEFHKKVVDDKAD